MGAFFDDIKDVTASLRSTASDVSDIRTDWVATQSIFTGDNIPVQQAVGPAQVAQAQGNVLTASQWNADSIAKAISGGGGNSGLLILGGVLVAALLMMRMR